MTAPSLRYLFQRSLPAMLCVGAGLVASCSDESAGTPPLDAAADAEVDAGADAATGGPTGDARSPGLRRADEGRPPALGEDAGARPRSGVAAAPAAFLVPPPEVPDAAAHPDPVAALQPYLPVDREGPGAFCVQVRSVNDRNQARALCEQIEREEALPTHIFEAILPGRGTWYRICVGAEAHAKQAEARAREWSAEEGRLRRFMNDVAPGHAPYLVKARPALASRQPSEPQARLLLRAGPTGERPLRWIRDARGALLAAITLPQAEGRDAALFVAPDGTALPLRGQGKGDCVACEEVWRDPALSVQVVDAGDVLPEPGEELLLVERSEAGARQLSVVTVASWTERAIERRESRVLATSIPGLRMWGEARLAEADGDARRELLLVQREMPVVDERVCALRTRSQLLDFSATGVRVLDENLVLADVPASSLRPRTLALLQVLDAIPDPDAASRVCAATVSGSADEVLARACLERVRRLLDADEVRAATQAAGLLAEASAAMRATVAPLFLRAASRLDAHPNLRAYPADCAAHALLDEAGRYDDARLAELSALRRAERRDLAELADAVFLSGIRDFGAQSAIGAIVSRWLAAMEASLPARHAALQAALLPPGRSGTSAPTAGARP